MRILKPGKFHSYAVVTCTQCEAIIQVGNHECIKLIFEHEIEKYVFKCEECDSQVMVDEDQFSSRPASRLAHIGDV